MASSRADEVAEVLWELKRAGKISTYTHIARRAGFSAGSNGRAMESCMRVVRRDWPHLHWWRAVKDDGILEIGCEQEARLKEAGFEVEHVDGKKTCTVISLQSQAMTWVEEVVPAAGAAETVE